jgi:hypothetical protein
MRYSFIRTFERDRAVSPDELDLLVELASRDEVIDDDDERHVVGRIFRRFRRDALSPEEWGDIERFKRRLGV